jgi:anti-anti-sigma factor
MEVTASVQEGTLVLAPKGRIDHASAEEFAQALAPHLAACEAGETVCVLDMAGVDYISSVGLRVLMMASKQVHAHGGRLVIARLTPLVQEVFQISRFDKIFELFGSVEAAQAPPRTSG